MNSKGSVTPLAIDASRLAAMIDAAFAAGVREECGRAVALPTDSDEPRGGPHYDLDLHIELATRRSER
jgi:hypothetical protein